MAKVVFIAAHAGYPASVPLGGGAVVADRLIREWAPVLGPDLLVLGSGPQAPAQGIRYRRIPEGKAPELTRLSVLGYARFCRDFSAAALAGLARESRDRPAVFLNDISEAPDAEAAASGASRLISLWHVDVADYIGRVALKSETAARWAPRAYESLRGLGLARALPSVLGLIFEKQRAITRRADAVVLPSQEMRRRLLSAYGGVAPGLAARVRVMPWGSWEEPEAAAEVAAERADLTRELGLGPGAFVLITLSRISPEKGLDVLLRALALLENKSARLPEQTHLLICGESAFMWGVPYMRTLRGLAERLRRVRVHFLGHVQGARKQAALSLGSLFVSPSIHESYGLAIQEGLRAGLPVAASDSFGARELLREGACVIARYEDRARRPASLAAALEPLLAEPSRLEPMRKRVREAPATGSFRETARLLLDLALG